MWINDLTFNPNFSDWLMGWPIGWTDPTQPVTEWSLWLQRMRGELSKLPLPNKGDLIACRESPERGSHERP